MQSIINQVREYLEASHSILVSHNGADYLYLEDADFDFTGYSSYPVSPEEAWKEGYIDLDPDGIDLGGAVKIPYEFDVKKIRRRAEDALRKTGNNQTVLAVAIELGCKLD